MRKKWGSAEPVPLRRIARLFTPYRRMMVVLVVLVVVQSAAGVAPPFFLRGILDHALPHRDAGLVSLLALGMIASSVLSGGLGVLSNQLSTVIGQHVMHDLRVAVYGHLQRMSLAFFTRTRTGDLLSRVVNDVGGVDNVLTSTASTVVQNTVAATATVIAMVVLDWRLAVLALLVVPVFLLVTFRLGGQRRAIAKGRQRGVAALTSMLEESLSVAGVLLGKTMGQQDAIRGRFATQSREISQLELALSLAGRWRMASRRMALTIVPAIVYWLAGLASVRGEADVVTLGTVVAFASMVNRLIAPVSSMQGIGQQVSTSGALFVRIYEVLDLPVEYADRPGAKPLPPGPGAVSFHHVSFRYGDAPQWTLSGIDLSCPAGTTTAIVGETGSGKTTLAYLVSRLYEPDEGSVTIDGVDIREVTMDSLTARVGLVTQDNHLMHGSVRDNLLLGKPDATEEELVAAMRAARVHDLVAGLPDGCDTMVGQRGYRFSGGERQRLAIARMLLRNPAVLVLDEATSALDTRTERLVHEALDELAVGRTTLVIAHRLATIERADQIVVLDHGRIVEHGTHADLVALAGRYAGFLRPSDDPVDPDGEVERAPRRRAGARPAGHG